jgi:putative endonuclease
MAAMAEERKRTGKRRSAGRPSSAGATRSGASPVSGGWCVYLLRCRDGTLYAGSTNDLPKRLIRHEAGKGARYTRSRLPVALVYRERVRDRGAALRREAALKRLTREEKLALVARPRRARKGPLAPKTLEAP